jgi:PncC family amidohydrolase
VSAPVAKQMAQNIRKLFKTDFGISITGIAGPTGGTPKKPVGTVYICVCDAKRLVCEHTIFQGSRLEVKKQSADRALALLLGLLKK